MKKIDELAKNNIEVFFMSEDDLEAHDWRRTLEEGENLEPGYYAWSSLPGCIPDSEPVYMGTDADLAIEQAYEIFLPSE